jgi:hypothetical protein
MIPLGYCTIPEAIRVLEHIFGEGEPKALGWLEAGLLDGALQVFTEREREYDVEVCRVPWEDVKGLGLLDCNRGGPVPGATRANPRMQGKAGCVVRKSDRQPNASFRARAMDCGTEIFPVSAFTKGRRR